MISSLRVLENCDRNPAADRLLLNMIRHAAGLLVAPPAAPPPDLEAKLRAIGYR